MTNQLQARRRAAILSKPLFGFSLCMFAPLAPAYAQTLPSGGQVVAGTVSIETSGSRTDMRQSTDKAIVEWKDFSIGKGGTVSIDNGSGATLNRVTGGTVSSIDGLLQATGSVYLINRNGIVIGKSGQVDVGGRFVGSTQDISNESFLAGGNQTLAGASEAALVNYGKIGSLGGDVVLVAAKVENRGSIEAANGTAGLLAGYQVMLRDQAHDDGKFSVVVGGAGTSATNLGVLRAAEAELRAQNGNIYALAGTSSAINAQGVSNKGGRIFLTAGPAGEVSISSTLTARKADGSGGAIEVTGKNILLDQGAKLDASGTTGGTVLVGGDWQGGANADTRLSTRDIQHAEAVVVAPDAKIDVTGSAGAGGKAVLWSDNFTNFHGTIDASGTTDGGRVETSSKNVLQVIGTVDAKAGSGKAGEWLLDPASVTISTAADASATYTGGTYTPTAGTSTINVTTLNGRLNSGTNVTISTGGSAVTGGTGDITLATGANIVKGAGGDAALTLKADRNIILNGAISSTSGKLTVNLNSRANDAADGYVQVFNSITTNGGDLNIWGGSGAVGSGAAISNTDVMAGVLFSGLASGGSIDVGSGSVNVTGSHIAARYTDEDSSGVRVDNMTIRAGGAITMTGTSLNGNGMTIRKTSGSATYSIAGGTGPMTLTGTTSSALSKGFYTYAIGLNSVDGDISVKGSSTNTAGTGTGLDFYYSTAATTGTGNISFDGSASNLADTTTNNGHGTRIVSGGGGGLTTATGAITIKGTSVTSTGLFLDIGSGPVTSTSGNINLIGASTSATLSKEAILFGGGTVTVSTGGAGALSIVGTSAANGVNPAFGASNSKATIRAGNADTNIYPTLTLAAGTGGLTMRANGTASGSSGISLSTAAGSAIKSSGAMDIYSDRAVNLYGNNGAVIQQTGVSGTVSIGSGGALNIGNVTTYTNDAISLTGASMNLNPITLYGSGDVTITKTGDGGILYTPAILKKAAATGASKLTVRAVNEITVGPAITAEAGAGKLDVTLNSSYGDNTVRSSDINITGNITTQGGDVTAYGTSTPGGYAEGFNGGYGVRVQGTTTIDARRGTTEGGTINFFGRASVNVNNNGTGIGVYLYDGAVLRTAGTGGINLNGASTIPAGGSATAADRSGISIGSNTLTAGTGGISLTGYGKDGYGLFFRDSTSQSFSTTGTLALDGNTANSNGIYRSSTGGAAFTGKDIVFTASVANLANSGLYFGGGSVTLNGSNSVSMIGSGMGSQLNIAAQMILSAGAGGVTLKSNSPAVIGVYVQSGSSSITSAGTMDISSGNGITIAGTIRQTAGSGSSIVADTGNVVLSSSVLIDTNDLLVQSKTGTVNYGSLATTAGSLNLEAAINVNGGALTSGSALTVTAGKTGTGTIDAGVITQTGATGAVTLTAPGYITTGNINLATANATTITTGGTLSTGQYNLNGSTAVTVSAVNNLTLATVNKVAAATGASSFTAKSQGNVTVSNAITAAAGAGKLDVTLVSRSADAATGTITVSNGITTQGGNILLRGGSAALSPLIDPTADQAAYTSAMQATGTIIDISSASAAFTAGGGDIEMRALGSNAGAIGFNLTGKTLATTGSGSLRLYALGRTTDQYAVQTNSTTNLSTANGDLVIMGASRYAGADAGVYLNAGTISSTAGAITISGTGNGASAAGSSYGVLINASATAAVSGAKALTINGRGGAASANGTGISISGGASVRSTAAGAINLTGFGGGASGSAALTHSGIFFDGANNFAIVNATGSGAVTLTGRAGNANSYGIYQGNTASSNIGTSSLTGDLTLVANSMFLNAKNGATPVAAKLLTKGVLTLRPEDGGNLVMGSDIYAGFINNNVLTGAYSGIVFGGSTGTGTGLTLYTQNGANTYAIPVTLAGTGTVSVTGDTDNKPLIANGGLALAGSGVFSQTVDINATQLTGSAGTVSFNNSGNTIGKLGPMSLSNKLDLFTSSALEINGAVTTGSAVIRSVGDLTMTAGSSVSAGATGTALQLVTNGKFFNNSGAGALSAANGRWLVWLQDPTNDVGGLSYSFRQYGASYGITAPAQTTGNGVMYNQMPLLSISLKDNVTKVYDGTTDAALTQANFNVTGLLGNDKATVYALGSFDNKNVSASKTVTADEMAVVVRDGAIRIYGYGLANYTASAVMGSITPRALTASLTGPITKTYDGSATAALSASNYLLANTVSGDNISLVMPTTGLYDNKNAGNGKTVTVSGLALSGTDAANYTVNGSATANWGVVTPKALSASLTGTISRVYDGTTFTNAVASSNYALSGIESGDTVSVVAGLNGTYADRNVGSGIVVTVNGLSLTGAAASNYTVASTASGAVGSISRKALTVTAADDTKVYDGNYTSSALVRFTGLVDGDTATATQVFTHNSARATTTYINGYTINDGRGGGNYTVTTVQGAGLITQRVVGTTLTANNKVYDGNLSATGTFSALSNVVSGDDVLLSASGGSLSFLDRNAGNGKSVVASGYGLTGTKAANYTLAPIANGTAAITPKALTATASGETKVYDGTTTSGGTVTWSGLIAGDTASGTQAFDSKNAGSRTLIVQNGYTISDGNNGNNYVVTKQNAAGTITAKQISASLTGTISKVYDGTTTAALSGTSLNGVVAGDVVTVSATAANYASKNAGTNLIVTATGLSLGGAGAANYALSSTSASGSVGTITPRSIAVTTSGSGSKTYDAATGLTGAQLSGVGFTLAQGDSTTQSLLSADGVTLNTSGISGTLADKNAGTGKAMTVTGYGLANNALGNYVLSSTTANGIADVARAALTMTASSMSKTYTGTTSSIGTVTISGLQGSDTASATQAYDSKNAGSRLLQVQNGYVVNDGNGGLNYIVSRIDAAGTIYKRAVSTVVHVNDKVYDGTTTATGTFDPLSGVISGDIVAASGTLSFANKNAANGKAVSVAGAVLTGADAGNYVLDPIANGTANITKANLVLTAVSDSRAYDGTTNSAGVVQAAGIMAGDSFSATQGFDAKDAGVRALQVNSGWSVNDGNGGNNYVITTGSAASGTITRKVLTATASVNDKVYDGTTTAMGDLSSLGGIVGADNVVLDKTNGSLAFYDRNAGINKAVTATGYALGGTDAQNYQLSSIANSSATISQAQLVLSAVTDTRQYDGTTASAGAVQASGLIAGDGFVATQRFDGFKAGAHTLQVDSYTVFDGNGGGNYAVSYGGVANGTISQRILQATATVQNKVYDGTTTATGIFSGLDNTIMGDDVSLDHSGATLAFYDRNAGAGKTVTISGAGLSGADAANYVLSDIANGTAEIAKATLVLTASSDARDYDGTTGSIGIVQSNGLVAGDTVSAAQAFDTKNAGNRTLQVSDWTIDDGNGGGNYAVVLGAAANGRIDPKLLSGALTGTVTKVYDRTTAAALQPLNIAGVIAGDDLTVTTASSDFADANIGTGKMVTVSGMQLNGTDASNYILGSTSASAAIGTITPRQVTVTVTGRGSKTYDGSADLAASQYGTLAFLLAQGDSATQAMLSADGVGLDAATLTATLADRNAGNGKGVTLDGFSLANNGLGNYALTTSSATGLADVARATLTLTAVSENKVYDGKTDSIGIVQSSGLIAGDSVVATQAFDSKNAGNRNLVVNGYTVEDGNGGANYIVLTNTAQGQIERKQIVAALTGTVTKTYDGTTAATILPTNIAGLIAGDDLTVNTSAADFGDRNAGTGKLVTVSGIHLTGSDAANYDLIGSSASANVGTITARQVSVTASGLGAKTYDGTNLLTTGQLGSIGFTLASGDVATQNLLQADGVWLDGSAVIGLLADRNAGTGKGVTLGGYALANNGLGNYVLTSSTTQGLVDVARAGLLLSAVGDAKTYDGTTASSGVVQITGLVAGDMASATQAFDSRNAGGRVLKVQNGYVIEDGNGGANYIVTLGEAAGTIDRRVTSTTVSVDNKVYDGTAAATGTFSPLTNLVAGDTVGATGSLAFADRNAGLGKTVTVNNASLTGADAGNYILDPVANGVADIARAALVLIASTDSKVYDGTATSTANVVATGLVGSDSIAATQAFDSRNAGVRALQVQSGWSVNDGNGGNNYAVTIGSAAAGSIAAKVISATATVGNKVYDGTTTANGTFADLSGVIVGDEVSLNSSHGSLAFVDRNAGTGKAVVAHGYTLDGADAANYTLDSIAQGTADILKAALVLNATGATKAYDGTTASNGTVQAIGLVAGDNVSATQFYDGRNAGNRTLTVDGNYAVYDGNGGNNYTVSIGSSADGLITAKVLNATATVQDKVYDGTTSATGTFTGLDGVVTGDLVSLYSDNGSMAFIDRNAGNGKSVVVSGLSLTGQDSANYTLSGIANGTANIAKAALTMTASGDSKVYDGKTDSIGLVTITGLIAGDTANAIQSFDTKNAGNRTLHVSGYTIDDGNNGNNYAVSLVDASGSIGQKILSGSLTGTVTKVYDGTDVATLLPVNLDGVIAGDALTLTTTGATYADRNVGTGKRITVAGMSLTGEDAGNYVLLQDYATADIGAITPRAVTVTTNGHGSKIYDGTATLSTGQLGSIGFVLADGDSFTRQLLAADGVTLDRSAVTGQLADRNAGTGKAVTLSGYQLADNDLGNYVLASPSAFGVADIARAVLTLAAVGDAKTYDGTTASSGVVQISGLVAGDTASATQAFDSRDAGGRALQVTGWTLDDGNDGLNYIVKFETAAGTIAQRHVATTITANDKVYDGTTTASGRFGALSNLVAGDSVSITGSFAFADKNAGQGKAVSVSGIVLGGADGANYVLDPVAEVAASITPKAITAQFTGPIVKGYDGVDLATLRVGDIAFDGMIAGDEIGMTGTAHYADRNAGTAKVVTIADLLLNGADAGNYVVDSRLSASVGTITPRQVTVSFADGAKVQGTADPIFAYTIGGQGLVGGDSITGSAGRQAGEAPGVYAIGLGSLSAGSNYALTATPGTFTITAANGGQNGEGNNGGNTGGSNGGLGPLTPGVITDAENAAEEAVKHTAPSNTIVSTAPTRGGAGFDPGSQFGWGGTGQLPGNTPISVQIGYSDPMGSGDAVGTTSVETRTADTSNDDPRCQGGTDLRDCKGTVQGRGLPYPTNRVISPNLRFIQR
ncbi:YDG domain-containing protein [Sphingomonas sp. CJ20]